MWPVKDRSDLDAYLKEKLDIDGQFIADMGEVRIRKVLERKPKFKDEAIVLFEDKRIRDTVKAQAYRLASCRDEAGMRLHLPNHLQKDFKALMSLSYELKKKNPDLRRNVKFDENDLGLYMDIQIKKDGHWKRVNPEQARTANQRSGLTTGPDTLDADDLSALLGGRRNRNRNCAT